MPLFQCCPNRSFMDDIQFGANAWLWSSLIQITQSSHWLLSLITKWAGWFDTLCLTQLPLKCVLCRHVFGTCGRWEFCSLGPTFWLSTYCLVLGISWWEGQRCLLRNSFRGQVLLDIDLTCSWESTFWLSSWIWWWHVLNSELLSRLWFSSDRIISFFALTCTPNFLIWRYFGSSSGTLGTYSLRLSIWRLKLKLLNDFEILCVKNFGSIVIE